MVLLSFFLSHSLFLLREFHERIRNMYSWERVCEQTVSLYDQLMAEEDRRSQEEEEEKAQRDVEPYRLEFRKVALSLSVLFLLQCLRSLFSNRLLRHLEAGPFAGFLAAILVTSMYLIVYLLHLWNPPETIDKAFSFKKAKR